MEIEIKIIIRPSESSSAHEEDVTSLKYELEHSIKEGFTEITGFELDEIEIEVTK